MISPLILISYYPLSKIRSHACAFRFWGTRGSIATPGPATVHFGGNTLCLEVVTDSGNHFILDTGTGARPLGADIMQNAPRPFRAAILLSHTHWDHIQGFPFFAPLFVPGNEFIICAPEGVGGSLSHVLAGQMEFTYFPVQLDQLPGKIVYRDLPEGQHDIDGVRVRAQYLNHPCGLFGIPHRSGRRLSLLPHRPRTLFRYTLAHRRSCGTY